MLVKKISKKYHVEKIQVENLSGPRESVFSLFRSSPCHFGEKVKKFFNFIRFHPFPLLAHVGPLAVWGLGLLLFSEI